MSEPAQQSDWDRLNQIATAARKGWPLWEIGYEHVPPGAYSESADNEPAAPPLQSRPRSGAPPECLYLLTGLPDDRRAPARLNSPIYPLAAHAWRYADTWDGREHQSFWEAVLPRWPGQGHKPSHREALAVALVVAVERGVPSLERFLEDLAAELGTCSVRGLTALSFPVERLIREHIVELALESIQKPRHLDDDSARLPRVSEEDDRWAALRPLTRHRFTPWSTAGEASVAIIDAALRVAALSVAAPGEAA